MSRINKFEIVRGNDDVVDSEKGAFLDGDDQENNKSNYYDTKRIACLLIILCLILVTTVVAISTTTLSLEAKKQSKEVLRFRIDDDSLYWYESLFGSTKSVINNIKKSNWTFQVMQITDIHLGEDPFTDWGPQQDRNTWKLLDKLFAYERPDLIVLGGDQLTANNCLGNCTKYYEILGTFLSQYNIPWALVMGNHDDLAFETPQNKSKTIPHNYTRRELLAVDQAFQLSLSKSGPIDITGVTNYVLDVMEPDTNEPALQIFFLDSGGGTLPEIIDKSQVNWFKEQATVRPDLPAVAFQHIPVSGHIYDESCTGFQGQEMSPMSSDGGLVDAMVESGRFHFLGVGHFHGNDYCCPYQRQDKKNHSHDTQDLYFCFGRHSGYGGYGSWTRGVRMYELLYIPDEYVVNNMDKSASLPHEKSFKWRTWVRLESGAYVDFLDYDH